MGILIVIAILIIGLGAFDAASIVGRRLARSHAR